MDVSQRASGQDQRFDAFRLSASQGEICGSLSPVQLDRLEERLFEGDGSSGHIDWAIRGATDEQGRPAVTVSIEAALPVECQRCLGRLDLQVSQSTTLLLARDDAELVRLDDASEREVVLASAPLDVVALVEDELLLTLPFAPRHEQCGAAGAASDR